MLIVCLAHLFFSSTLLFLLNQSIKHKIKPTEIKTKLEEQFNLRSFIFLFYSLLLVATRGKKSSTVSDDLKPAKLES
jgi:hypothetical protein